jgi:CRP-like cAMP-binding protein/Zn-dependent protease
MRKSWHERSVYEAVASALESDGIGPPATPAGVWAKAGAARRRRRKGGSVWKRLAERLDPGRLRPKLADDVEIKEFRLRWGNDYAMIANPRDLIYYRMEPGELEVLRLMDGTRTVKEIVVERFRESGDLDLSSVADLVLQLHEGNFLDQRFLNVDQALERALHPVSVTRAKARQFARTLSIDWKDAERLVRWFYHHGLKWFFRPSAQVVAAAVSIAGFIAFVSLFRTERFSLTEASPAAEGLILLGLNYFLTFAHELGHAVVLVHYGRRVKSAGFMIFFGSPAFFVDASDGLMMDRRQRIVQAWAGPYSEMILAGSAALLAFGLPESTATSVLYKFALLNYFVLFMNLVPLLELDGYWILSDLIQVPELRPMSLAFVRHDLWHKLRNRMRFTLQEIGLALYGIVGVAFTIFAFWTAFFFWRAIFGGLVSRLWNGGIVTRAVLVALILFVGGPAIRGGASLVRALVRRARSAWRQVRFRLETRWRVEAAELIDALPMFEDLGEDVLSDLAGRVRLRAMSVGQPVVRQGERAEAFFVVRTGTLQVVEEDSRTGNERVIRILGRGESFGELALVRAAPRSATVRALEDAEVFEIDKGTFDRLLAEEIRAPDLAPTLQAVAELGELPCFSHLEPDELSEVLSHGEWVTLPPGETVVAKGEIGDAFYALRSGQVEVSKDGGKPKVMGPGSFFGEVALLLDVPRTATVRTRTPVRAFRLDREGFDRLLARAFRRGTLKPQAGRTWQH